jgi:hypothetical protein
MTLVAHVRLSVPLAGPGPSGSAGPSRRCQGCFPSSPASPGSDCPPLRPGRCDDPAVKVSHLHSNPWRLVALDVGDPQLVRCRPGEVALDQVGRDQIRCGAPPPRPAGHAVDAGPGHEHLDGAMRDDQAAAEGGLGVHPPGPVGAVGGGMHLQDLVGRPHVMNRPGRRRPGPPGVVARLRPRQHPGGQLGR